MKQKAWFFLLTVLLISSQIWARPYDPYKDSAVYRTAALQEADRIVSPTDEFNPRRVVQVPMRDDVNDVAFGEDMIIGYTWYDYQHNGSIGKMIARDADGGTHFCYMRGYNAGLDPRRVFYNFLDENGNLANNPEELQGSVDEGTRSGYTCMDVLPADGRGMIFYHVLGHIQDDPDYVQSAMSSDWMRGIGAFIPTYLPPYPDIQAIWPHGAIDNQNFAHVLSTEYDEEQLWQRVFYWRGEGSNDFWDWEWYDRPIIIDTASVISAVVAASPQSNKVALAWHKNRVGSELGPWENARGGYQRNNDLMYLESEDGEEWDFRDGPRSMTKIIPPNADLVDIGMEEAYGDTFRPYCDIDIQYDPWEGEDNLYGVFAASGFKEEPVPDDDPAPVDIVYAVHGHLWFWNSEQDTITLIADGWYNNYMSNPASGGNFRPGAWRLNVDRGSIAFDPENPGIIYVVWVCFPHIQEARVENNQIILDFLEDAEAQDTSEAGYLNAEIMVSISTDRGITWREPVNITQTIWDGDDAPEPGECQSENWASVAELADGALHILYVRDTDAGGIAQTEGSATNSPVIYHRVDLEDLPLNDPMEVAEGFMFHNYADFRPRVSDVLRGRAAPIPGEAVQITANVEPAGGFELTEIYLQYVVNGEQDGDTVEVEMNAEGNSIFSGEIPSTEEGDNVWYRIRATDDNGGESFMPVGWWYSYVSRPVGGLLIHDIQYRPRTWTVDYSPYMGYEVTVEGIITTPPLFAETYGAYAIQEAEEAWSGVMIRGVGPDFSVGDRVQVTGVVMERDPDDPSKWRYATYIDVSEIEILGEEDSPEPILVEVSDLNYEAFAEDYESVLVQVEDVEIGIRVADGLESLYLPIIDPDAENPVDGWMATHGLDEDQLVNLGIEEWIYHTSLTFISGVFAENQRYAIAPRDGTDFGQVSVREEPVPAPQRLALDDAYPNPFNAVTRVGFELPEAGYMNLSVYDLAGRLVATLVEGEVGSGHYNVMVDASALTTGVYILRLETTYATVSQKLVLVK